MERTGEVDGVRIIVPGTAAAGPVPELEMLRADAKLISAELTQARIKLERVAKLANEFDRTQPGIAVLLRGAIGL